jgi:hypothetical protein
MIMYCGVPLTKIELKLGIKMRTLSRIKNERLSEIIDLIKIFVSFLLILKILRVLAGQRSYR